MPPGGSKKTLAVKSWPWVRRGSLLFRAYLCHSCANICSLTDDPQVDDVAPLRLGVDLALVPGLVRELHGPDPQQPDLGALRGVLPHHGLEAEVRRVGVAAHAQDAQLARAGNDPRQLEGRDRVVRSGMAAGDRRIGA